ncbi:MAG: phosphodiester glycosidase family protein [Sphaerochaeta sp.]|jgi:hypothetical protein|uniref:phosphodiester glycosidase family protein n=2 Tax=Sphaerochaeta TaxID=399320 RepID=UPI0031F5048A|nr:phosphodiester glycosidase family protein [Sphaerochaeta sp.]
MTTQIITHVHPSGEIQRYQIVEDFQWENLQFESPGFNKKAVSEIARLYRINIVRKNPAAYGTLVFFHVEENTKHPFILADEYSNFFSLNVAASIHLNKMAEDGRIFFKDRLCTHDWEIEKFLDNLQLQGLLDIVKGDGNGVLFIPLNAKLGFPSTIRARLVVNTHFFLMDPTDLDSPYCELGTPHGLALKNGTILNPPLNHRPCFVVDQNNKSSITNIELTDLEVEIDGKVWRHKSNAIFHYRPDERVTPQSKGTDIIITENKVIAIKKGGCTQIPMAGFVISIPEIITIKDTTVCYHGLENIQFGIQVGPPMVQEYTIVDTLCCPFYNKELDSVPYPSTVYPLPFETARAARIALGTNKKGDAVLLWAEGAGKLTYTPGQDSTGASLLELATFCSTMGYENIINLDGGGSAQILYDGNRLLKIADRYDSNEEAERPVPLVLTL